MSKYRAIDTELRREALRFFGFNPNYDDSLKAYEIAYGKYINDREIREKVVWMKYDKTKMGKFKLGEEIITEGIDLYDFTGAKHAFKNLLKQDMPNVIISGSIS